MDSITTARLLEIMPELAAKIVQMDTILEQEGTLIRVVQGLRTWSQQDALYAQGRTAPGARVTNARGGWSYHNFGLAVDCVPSQFDPDLPYNPDWDSSHPNWQRMIEVGTSLGLTSGAHWETLVDMPHFQLTGRFPEAAPTDEVRQLFKDGGTEAIWDEARKSL
jgi:peptidoglycan L-alanyl-D-glutamate endopeptidase CwlK